MWSWQKLEVGRPVRLGPLPITPGCWSLGGGQGERLMCPGNKHSCSVVYAEFYIGSPVLPQMITPPPFFPLIATPLIVGKKGSVKVRVWLRKVNASV